MRVLLIGACVLIGVDVYELCMRNTLSTFMHGNKANLPTVSLSVNIDVYLGELKQVGHYIVDSTPLDV